MISPGRLASTAGLWCPAAWPTETSHGFAIDRPRSLTPADGGRPQPSAMEVLSLAVVGLMAGAAALWRIPANACDECDQPRRAPRVQRRRQDEWHRKLHAWYGTEHCPVCKSDA